MVDSAIKPYSNYWISKWMKKHLLKSNYNSRLTNYIWMWIVDHLLVEHLQNDMTRKLHTSERSFSSFVCLIFTEESCKFTHLLPTTRYTAQSNNICSHTFWLTKMELWNHLHCAHPISSIYLSLSLYPLSLF